MKRAVGFLSTTLSVSILAGMSYLTYDTHASAGQMEWERIEAEHQEELQEYQATQIACLALNVYYETRASSLADAMAVSDVVLNRVQHTSYPNTVCEVVQQGAKYADGNMIRNQCQFSWYCDGRSDTPTNSDAWEKSRKYARDIYLHNMYLGITEGATHYHANYVAPSWAPTMDRITRIGSHIFYRLKGK